MSSIPVVLKEKKKMKKNGDFINDPDERRRYSLVTVSSFIRRTHPS